MAIDLLAFVPRCEPPSAGGRELAAWRPHRSWARRTVAALAALLVLSAVGSAMAQGRRLALVVGNDAYRAQSALRNAVNDAQAVASALGEVGFAVTRVENASRSRLTSALAQFAGSLRGDDVALFYFAGHGVQVDQENYLMPTDYAGQSAAALRFDAVSASDVQEMLRPAQVAMLVFDACRNNPYRGVRGGTGLAPMEARGTLIAYAAGAGEVASDGPGASNGLFTSKLVEALREPGLTASALFMQVRREVVEASAEEQWPAVYNDLLSDFVFRPGLTTGGATDVAAPGGAVTSLRQETVFWESIRASTDPADFEAYLEQFANGTFSRLARNRLAALRRPGNVSRPSADPPRRRRSGDVFRDCAECPEMVVLPGGLAMGRYEVTVGEYRAFVSATGGTGSDLWREQDRFRQTDRHPVVMVSWHDAQRYVSWLSRTTGETYRLPTEAEWGRAAVGSPTGCANRDGSGAGTCEVGTNGANAWGLSDMVGNVWEWTSDCWESDCVRRVLRGGDFTESSQRSRVRNNPGYRLDRFGFRVSRMVDEPDTGLNVPLPAADPPDRLRPGGVFRDCPSCPEMVVIPAGEFQMGSPRTWDEEMPQRRVRVEQFALGRYEVTRAEYAVFAAATGRDPARLCLGGVVAVEQVDWQSPGYPQTDDHPVVCVSWSDARAYVRWLSRETRVSYRLPSEAEWEYAARGGTTTSRYWGEGPSGQCANANGADAAALRRFGGWTWTQPCTDGRVFTAPVGTFGANGFGLFDVLGNVDEWVEDCWHDNYRGAPSDGRAWTSGVDCERRVLRGGSWQGGSAGLRSTNREGEFDTFSFIDAGFRVARRLD